MSTPSPTPSAMAGQPHEYRVVGVVLAIGSGVLIGSSFVLKKRGLLASQDVAGEGVAYLKSPLWWSGMIMMILGELCNFGAYAFVEALLVTPLGALSVCISAILSHFFLKEKLTLFGWIGCVQCILGSIIIALNGPEEQSVTTIEAFKHLFLAPWFLAFGGVVIAAAVIIVIFIAPKYGTKNMLWYILVCSLIGGLSVSCTQGLGACIVTSIRGDNQFKNWFIYFLLAFVACTLLTEIFYLNKALALFNTAMVTPTYYVLFTFCTLVTSVILYKGLKASAAQIVTIVLAFFVICTGIFVLQMSRVDPRRLQGVDSETTILIRAAQEDVKPPGDYLPVDPEKHAIVALTEEPGMDALRGTFGAIGTLVRARRRTTMRRKGTQGSIAHPQVGNGASHPPSSVFIDSPSSIRRSPLPDSEEPTISRLLAAEGNELAVPLLTLNHPIGDGRHRATSIKFVHGNETERISEKDERQSPTRVESEPAATFTTLRPAQPQRSATGPGFV